MCCGIIGVEVSMSISQHKKIMIHAFLVVLCISGVFVLAYFTRVLGHDVVLAENPSRQIILERHRIMSQAKTSEEVLISINELQLLLHQQNAPLPLELRSLKQMAEQPTHGIYDQLKKDTAVAGCVQRIPVQVLLEHKVTTRVYSPRDRLMLFGIGSAILSLFIFLMIRYSGHEEQTS